MDRANQSIEDTARIFDALGLLSTEEMVAHVAARKEATPEAEKRRTALREAIAFKDYEFNCHGVELDQRYESTAVVPDGSPREAPTRDAELYHHPSSRPGAKIPHAWLTTDHRRQVSTLDVVGHGRFTVVTGIGGDDWTAAARRAGAALGFTVPVVVIGPGQAHDDLYGDWARLRGTSAGGARRRHRPPDRSGPPSLPGQPPPSTSRPHRPVGCRCSGPPPGALPPTQPVQITFSVAGYFGR